MGTHLVYLVLATTSVLVKADPVTLDKVLQPRDFLRWSLPIDYEESPIYQTEDQKKSGIDQGLGFPFLKTIFNKNLLQRWYLTKYNAKNFYKIQKRGKNEADLSTPLLGDETNTKKMKMVLRQLFSNDRPRDGRNGVISFKMDKQKFQNLVRYIKEENKQNSLSKIGNTEPEEEANPSFKMGLKWFNRIN